MSLELRAPREDEVRHWFTVPDIWMRVAERVGELVGYLDLSKREELFNADIRAVDREAADTLIGEAGWVGILGVRLSWRRRGLATALLQHSFRDFRARGATRVGLGVDAENTTGAVRLYERVGMQVVRRDDTYEKTL